MNDKLSAALSENEILFYIAAVIIGIFLILVILMWLFKRYPELELKLAKLTWGDNAHMEIYNREKKRR